MKVLSDLLISVARAEREEARMRVRYESARLGNVAVVRYLEFTFIPVNI